MRSAIGIALALALVFGLTAFARGDELALSTERVVVFKDGYCLVVKKATGVSDENGTAFTEDVPDAAILGSFWAIPAGGRLLSMTGGVVTEETVAEEAAPVQNQAELLQANVGKRCTIELYDQKLYTGVIKSVLMPNPGYAQNWFVVLETVEGDTAVPIVNFRRITIPEMSVEIRRKETRKTKRLTFRFEGGAVPRELTLLYFRPGVRWIPTYRVALPEDPAGERADVSLQAEILNEAEDLTDVAVDLVVGVPNFRFREVVSPFVLERALQNALREAAPQLMSQVGTQNFFSNRAGESFREPPPAAPGDAPEFPADLTAGASQDHFVYHLPRMTLPKGHRAAVPIFDTTARLGHVYTWDLHVARTSLDAAPAGEGDVSPLSLSRNRIWHQVELANGTDAPWTTGAVFVTRGGLPVAQELLAYTPPGATVRVPLTVAVNVRGEYEETETGRDLDGLNWNRVTYARIDRKGVLTVRNFESRPIRLEIVATLGGRADEASDDAKIRLEPYAKEDWQNYRGHPEVNNRSVVTFTLEVPAGGTVSPTVSYHYFAAR